MNRRGFLSFASTGLFASLTAIGSGCRSTQHAHVLNETDRDMVGSHTAGAETWEPLIEQSVGQLLGRQSTVMPVAANGEIPYAGKRICFVGVENKSAEEIGDFKEQIYQKIDTCITNSEVFDCIHRKYVEAGLRQCGLRPDDLFVPAKRRQFVATMEELDQPFDYLLYATITSGTTKSNEKNYQRDYLLALEMIDLQSGRSDKESAELRKGYHKSRLGKAKHY
jgi:hypothetical protein